MLRTFLLFSFILSPAFGQSLACPKSYTLILNKCLQAFPISPVFGNHSAAEDTCRKDGGTLVTIRNAIENRAVAKFAADKNIAKIWIGTFCFGNDTSKCVYDDNSGPLSTYNGFEVGYPLVTDHDDGCVLMFTQAGNWVSSWCNPYETVSPVCEVPAYTNIVNIDPRCIIYNGYCYLPQQGNYEESMETCESFNGNTLSIHSQRENDFIQNLIGTNQTQIFIGAKRIYSNKFGWTDGSGWGDYDNRDPLDFNFASLNCLAMQRDSGVWRSIQCSAGLPYFCKVPLPPSPNTDFSYCNSTLLMAPASITSYGYPNPHNLPSCTWKVGTVGAYRLRISFTELSSSLLTVYDVRGNVIGEPRSVQSLVAPSNYITVVQKGGGRFKAEIRSY